MLCPEISISLTHGQLVLLKTLVDHPVQTQKELSIQLGIDQGQTSRWIHDLMQKGFIEKSKGQIRLASTHHATELHDYFLEKREIKVDKILSGAAIPVLLLIAYRKATTEEIVLHSKYSFPAVYRTLSKLCNHGIIIREGKFFKPNPFHRRCFEFIRAFQRYLNRKRISRFRQALILWEDGCEFLFRTPQKIKEKGFYLTSHRMLAEYGLSLIIPSYFVYFTPLNHKKPSLELVLLHLLCENPTSTRNILYALIVCGHNPLNWKRLNEMAPRYELEKVVGDLDEYLKTEGKNAPKDFPTWNEYQQKMEEYQ
jgi:predicted transcriptional regulator